MCTWHTAAQQVFLGTAIVIVANIFHAITSAQKFHGRLCPLETHELGVLKLPLSLQKRVGMETVGASPRGRDFFRSLFFLLVRTHV